DLVERPLGELVERTFRSDLVRGVVLTDGLIGTFARAHDASLAQNRCYLYHVIGGGTGDWDVPVGGMGAVVGALVRAARSAGAELRTHSPVTGVAPGPSGVTVCWTDAEGHEREVLADHVLAACSPSELARLRATGTGAGAEDRPEGAQLKVNMVLDRLPRL